jgi:hypothetical protein
MTKKLFSPKANKSPAKSQTNIVQERSANKNRQSMQLKMFQVAGRGGKGHGLVSASHGWNRKGRW